METNWVGLGCTFINLKKLKNISNSTHAHPYLGENYFIHYLHAIDVSQLVGTTHPLISHVVRQWSHATVMQYISHPWEPYMSLFREPCAHAPSTCTLFLFQWQKGPSKHCNLATYHLGSIPLVEEITPHETLQLSNQYSIYGHHVFNLKA